MAKILTPGSYGPWTFQANEKGDCIWIGNDAENAACVPGFTDHPQNIGNAKLIAAAPEMWALIRRLAQDEPYDELMDEAETLIVRVESKT